jgi:hypothetical protein
MLLALRRLGEEQQAQVNPPRDSLQLLLAIALVEAEIYVDDICNFVGPRTKPAGTLPWQRLHLSKRKKLFRQPGPLHSAFIAGRTDPALFGPITLEMTAKRAKCSSCVKRTNRHCHYSSSSWPRYNFTNCTSVTSRPLLLSSVWR